MYIKCTFLRKNVGFERQGASESLKQASKRPRGQARTKNRKFKTKGLAEF